VASRRSSGKGRVANVRVRALAIAADMLASSMNLNAVPSHAIASERRTCSITRDRDTNNNTFTNSILESLIRFASLLISWKSSDMHARKASSPLVPSIGFAGPLRRSINATRASLNFYEPFYHFRPRYIKTYTYQSEDIPVEISPKQARLIESVERQQWHTRQKDPITGELSKNKQFKQTPLIAEIMDYINRHKLGVRKRPRGKVAKEKKEKEEEKDDRSKRKKNKKDLDPPSEADRLFERKVQFLGAAAEPSQFLNQDGKMPEVAFVGRSNVGKSSLLNALTVQG